MSEPLVDTPLQPRNLGFVTAEATGLVQEITSLVEEATFTPPHPIRWHRVARSPHFWTAYRPLAGSDPTGWSLVQYGTQPPSGAVGDVRGWAVGGYAVRFTAPAGLPRTFTVSACYRTDLLSRVPGAAWLLRTRAFLNVLGPDFYREAYAPVQAGAISLVSMDVSLKAGVTYTIPAGAAIEIGVRDFKPSHYRSYAEMAGKLLYIRVERAEWDDPGPEPGPEALTIVPEGMQDRGEGQAPPEAEVLDETEVSTEELAAATRKMLGCD